MSIEAKYTGMKELRFGEDVERENELLRTTLSQLKLELDKFKRPPLIVCEVKKVMGDKAIVKLTNNHTFLVEITAGLKGKVTSKDMVLAEQKSLMIVDKLEKIKDYNTESFIVIEKPNITWAHIGGLTTEIEEIKEVIELPLKKPELFEKVGITPPKGILLHGPPGCGKTLLAKAVANSTNTTFIELVASELVQKFIGEGAKLVKEVFQLAKENSPSIIFIDEIDAIAAMRVDMGTSGEREVQRTFMQLLAEIDGFKNLGDVKIVGSTNRIDILDSALLRPGRLDRLIEIGLPDKKGRHEILKVHTKSMNLKGVSLQKIAETTESFSGAELRAVCTEAGYFAIRANRFSITSMDFTKAIEKVKAKDSSSTEYLNMYS